MARRSTAGPGGYRQFVASRLWKFGMLSATFAEFLAHFGWRVIEDVGYEELAKRYIEPTGRPLTSTPVERMVYARKV